jgi:serine/threonine-protein kinase
MLSGRPIFEGETVSDVLAAVLKTEPDWAALPAATPASVQRLLRRCLERDPRNRLRDIGDARLELAAPAEADEGSRVVAPARFASPPALAVMAALGVAALALALLQLRGEGPTGARDVVRTSIALPPGHTLVAGPEITRDGQRIAFVSTDGLSRPQLYTRRLDEPDLHRLEGTEEADQPFFSPDGRWIAFYARGGFFKVRVDGGEPVRLADSASGEGGHWLEDDTILFTTAWNSGLYRIDAKGGEAEPFLVPDRESYYAYVWPFVLPGEQAVLFNRWGKTEDLVHMNLADMSLSVLAPTQWRRSVHTASGHIVFAALGGDLLALPGEPMAAAAATPENVLTNVAGGGESDGYTRVSVSTSGTLVYAPLDDSKRSLVRVDRSGRSEAAPGPTANYEELRVSPDGRRVVVTSYLKMFVQDLVRGSRLPLAQELPRSFMSPVWTPDGSRVVFGSNHGGTWDVYSKSASGTGNLEVVSQISADEYPSSVMRDGTVVLEQNHQTTFKDIWLLPPQGEPQPWRVTPAVEGMARVSLDDRLMAFISNVSGRFEVYLQPVDRSSEAVPVSTNGGTGPVWSRAGDELYFRQGRLLMTSKVTARPQLEVSEPAVVFDAGWELGQQVALSYYQVNYDVMPDGRLLMVKHEPEAIPSRINVIFDWFEELNRLVPLNH